jgi:hypothetical protein
MKHGRLSEHITIDEIDGRCRVYPDYTHRITVRGWTLCKRFHRWVEAELGKENGYYSSYTWNKKYDPTHVKPRWLFERDTSSRYKYYINADDAMYVTIVKMNDE